MVEEGNLHVEIGEILDFYYDIYRWLPYMEIKDDYSRQLT